MRLKKKQMKSALIKAGIPRASFQYLNRNQNQNENQSPESETRAVGQTNSICIINAYLDAAIN